MFLLKIKLDWLLRTHFGVLANWSIVWDTVGISSDVWLHHLTFKSLMLVIVHLFCFPCFPHESKSAHFLKASLKLELLKCGSFRRLITVSGRWIYCISCFLPMLLLRFFCSDSDVTAWVTATASADNQAMNIDFAFSMLLR